ncbi:MAG: ParA family protein [Clostridiales bacterium]|jgi:chromosome partitioning protein|nr:ParA family protein [Clostridiales bacterium]
MNIISVANQKGGVGKTTSVLNIGAGLSKVGKKVLLIDLDPQNHLSRWLEHNPSDGKPTVSEMIYQEVSGIQNYDFSQFVRTHPKENVDFIPANHMLSGLLSILGTDRDSQNVLNRIFHQEFFLQYDYIVLDCQPSLDLLVANALKASDQLMIPVQADLLAYEGVQDMLTTFQKVKQTSEIGGQLRMLLTMYQKNTKMSNSVWEALKKSYGNLVFHTPIPFRAEAKNSTATRNSSVNSKNSEVGQQYMAVVKEMIWER